MGVAMSDLANDATSILQEGERVGRRKREREGENERERERKRERERVKLTTPNEVQ